jgi:predicted RNA-binding Zn ribbon-like protein
MAGNDTSQLLLQVMEDLSEVQPGGRPGAPGELGVVQAFVNTHNIEQAGDELPDAAALRRFLSRRGLLSSRAHVSADDHRRALELREALRALAAANNGEPLAAETGATLDRIARRSGLIAGFAPSGEPREAPTASGADQALGELLAIVHRAIRNGTWPRLKACHEHGCRWVFYDYSRNRSSTWCAMALCGTRAKMRTYRAKRGRATGLAETAG